jgi:pilus assembly protein FimV
LQATVDELNAKLQAQDEQSAAEKKKIAELQARLADAQQAATKPVEAEVTALVPVDIEEPETDWLLMCGGLMLLALLALAWLIRRRRQPFQAAPEPSAKQKRVAEPGLDVLGKPGESAAFDAQEGSLRNAGFDPQKLPELHARHPGLNPAAAAVPAAVAPGDEFQLKLDDLSMDANWDLIDSTAPPSSASTLPQPEIEWEIEPVSQLMDDSVLFEFAEPSPSPDAEPPKQTARSLLAGIR